ncbi:sensor protein RcsC [Salmonella enterica subsp. enterica]|uniref:Sensor protein RcsC n=1 Tax=Salmonella enterica I TaxID=59201 RepID=A0A379WQN8_SALET|nr:sensor protein RcsC [Salmonella enterica subsp. enterica]
MNHITANYLPLVVRKQLGLYCFIEPDVPVSLNGDPMRLQQVISNLLSNAIKFTILAASCCMCAVMGLSQHSRAGYRRRYSGKRGGSPVRFLLPGGNRRTA